MVITLGTAIAASWDSGIQSVGDPSFLRVQVRGTGFSGSVDIYQGESPTATMVTKTSGALVGYTAASEYYDLRPSSLIRVVVTLSAGTINEVLLAWGGKR